MSKLGRKLIMLIEWPFEIGREYKLENKLVYITHIGAVDEFPRTITPPDNYICDLFTGVPNLRMQRGEGALVSYNRFWGLGNRRYLWVSAAAVIHDWVFETAKDDSGEWITFQQANDMFTEILDREGWKAFKDLYTWGVNELQIAKDKWNAHNDGRPKA